MVLRPVDGVSSGVYQRIKSDLSILVENELCMRPAHLNVHAFSLVHFLACCVYYSRHFRDFNKQGPSSPHLTHSVGPSCGLGGFSVPLSQLSVFYFMCYSQR